MRTKIVSLILTAASLTAWRYRWWSARFRIAAIGKSPEMDGGCRDATALTTISPPWSSPPVPSRCRMTSSTRSPIVNRAVIHRERRPWTLFVRVEQDQKSRCE